MASRVAGSERVKMIINQDRNALAIGGYVISERGAITRLQRPGRSVGCGLITFPADLQSRATPSYRAYSLLKFKSWYFKRLPWEPR